MHKINPRFHDFMDPACFLWPSKQRYPRLEIEQSRAWNLYLGCPMGLSWITHLTPWNHGDLLTVSNGKSIWDFISFGKSMATFGQFQTWRSPSKFGQLEISPRTSEKLVSAWWFSSPFHRERSLEWPSGCWWVPNRDDPHKVLPPFDGYSSVGL